ncbi:MAG: hypothetical protein PHV02_20105 [Rhodocyclaceae bacterium]|nr:hypothetical protein [Rhodocyclaceae bacterium]
MTPDFSPKDKPSAADSALSIADFTLTAPASTAPDNSKHILISNPRELRALHALMLRPMPREQLDKAIGCSNSPDVIFRLRQKGFEAPCTRIDVIDRDGFKCRPGIFSLTEGDRRKVIRWNGSSQKGSIDLTLASWLSFALVCAVLLVGLI